MTLLFGPSAWQHVFNSPQPDSMDGMTSPQWTIMSAMEYGMRLDTAMLYYAEHL